MDEDQTMKSWMSLTVALGLWGSLASYVRAEHGSPDIEGIWLGVLATPDGRELRIVVEVFEKADGTVAAVMGSPDQGRMGIPFDEFTFTDGTMRCGLGAAGLVIEGQASADRATIDATLTQRGTPQPLLLKAVDELPGPPPRPQTPRRPFPYREEAVVFENSADGVKLSGTLTLPSSTRPAAAALLVAGSGPNTRNGTGMGHFLLLADYLTRHGVAVLRYDKRGVMRSAGDYGKATTEDFAADALAGVRYLRDREEIDSRQVGIIGHSEGGIIAAMVGARTSDVAFIVSLGGSGLNGHDLMVLQDCSEARANGATPEEIPVIRDWVRRFYAMARSGESPEMVKKKLVGAYVDMTEAERRALHVENRVPKRGNTLDPDIASSAWFREFLELDPARFFKQVECPVLALVGSKDVQVPPRENLEAIAAALRSGGNRRHTVRELPGLNHLFQTARTGSTTEYGDLEEIVAPEALITVTYWIMQQTGRLP